MIDFIHEIELLVEKYGLRIAYLDTTDVTLLSRIEVTPEIFIQVYRNATKKKLNMALVLGSSRIYGIDSEGGFLHEHPLDDPNKHITMAFQISVEEFVLKSLHILHEKGVL